MSYISHNGYACTNDRFTTNHKMHRVLWVTFNGPIPEGMDIDHINGDRLDNRPENLRIVTRKENMRNSKRYVTNISGVTGVGWVNRESKWRAKVMIDYKMKHLGYYDDWFEAVCARMSANNRYGFHENHGRR